MQKKHIVFVIILFLIVFIVIDAKITLNMPHSPGRNNSIIEFNERANKLENAEYKYSKSDDNIVSLNESEVEKVAVNNALGSINITAEKREDVHLEYTITVFSEEESTKADDLLDRLEISYQIEEETLEIKLVKPADIPEYIVGIKVDYHLRIPKELQMDIDNKYGDLIVEGSKNDIVLHNSYGLLSCRNITGMVKLENSYGRTEIHDIQGNTAADLSYVSRALIRDINGDLTLNTSFSQTEVENVYGDSNLNLSYGQLDFDELKGNINLESSFAAVTGQKISSPFQGDVEFGAIELRDVNADTVLTGNTGEVIVKLAPELKNFTLDCKTKGKDILTNLPFEVNESNGEYTLTGEEGTGEILINIESSNGDIEIKQ